MHGRDCFSLCSLSQVSLSCYNNVICLNTKNNVFNLAHMCKFYFCYTSRKLSAFPTCFKPTVNRGIINKKIKVFAIKKFKNLIDHDARKNKFSFLLIIDQNFCIVKHYTFRKPRRFEHAKTARLSTNNVTATWVAMDDERFRIK